MGSGGAGAEVRTASVSMMSSVSSFERQMKETPVRKSSTTTASLGSQTKKRLNSLCCFVRPHAGSRLPAASHRSSVCSAVVGTIRSHPMNTNDCEAHGATFARLVQALRRL